MTQPQLAAHSNSSCCILSIDFSFVDVVGIGGGFQDGGVGDRLAHPWLHTNSWLVYDTAAAVSLAYLFPPPPPPPSLDQKLESLIVLY